VDSLKRLQVRAAETLACTTLQTMQSLGLTVLRTWAFNDYGVNNTWQALQTAPQVFDERVFRWTTQHFFTSWLPNCEDFTDCVPIHASDCS